MSDPNQLLRETWRRFGAQQDELLDVALSTGEPDEGDAATLLGRLVGNIAFMGLQLASDPARPTLINTSITGLSFGR